MSSPSEVAFITYNGLLDPLGPSQILPYVEGLSEKWPAHILSFERRTRLDSDAIEKMQRRTASRDIRWVRRTYHKRPSLLATSLDVLAGRRVLRDLLSSGAVRLVHARGYVPMMIALPFAEQVPVLFDIRGIQAEEYVDGGVWREGELKYRLAKHYERKFFRAASGAVVLTEAIKPWIEAQFSSVGRLAPPIEVIPCCVDLDRTVFDEAARVRLRSELDLSAADATVFVYSGSLGTWYLPDAMAQFVSVYKRRVNGAVFLLWVLNNERELAVAASRRAGLADSEIKVVLATSDRVHEWLSAADVGLALIKPSFSKRSSSPTKYGEYLAAGLPVVASASVGDSTQLSESGVGVTLSDPENPETYGEAADRLVTLSTSRGTYRKAARALFDLKTIALPRYQKLYEILMST